LAVAGPRRACGPACDGSTLRLPAACRCAAQHPVPHSTNARGEGRALTSMPISPITRRPGSSALRGRRAGKNPPGMLAACRASRVRARPAAKTRGAMTWTGWRPLAGGPSLPHAPARRLGGMAPAREPIDLGRRRAPAWAVPLEVDVPPPAHEIAGLTRVQFWHIVYQNQGGSSCSVPCVRGRRKI
jgi:hypothetical protein